MPKLTSASSERQSNRERTASSGICINSNTSPSPKLLAAQDAGTVYVVRIERLARAKVLDVFLGGILRKVR
jgi:hypothetical protein